MVLERIAEELDELPTPCRFDLQAIEGLQNSALLDRAIDAPTDAAASLTFSPLLLFDTVYRRF